jgi:AcrR family transcriptional regulator
LRDRFRAATREAILDAAARLLTTEGAAYARMEDIAASAGVAVGTVYNYFEDRTALVTALLESRTKSLFDALDGSTGQAGVPSELDEGSERGAKGASAGAAAFEAELGRFVSAVAGHFDTNRFLLTVLLEEERHRGVDARAASRRRTVFEELLARAERLMSKGIRMRAIRKGDPALYASLLVGMLRGVAMSVLVRGEAFAASGTDGIVRVFMNGAAR